MSNSEFFCRFYEDYEGYVEPNNGFAKTLENKTSSEIKVELFELYNNFITDPDTKIIHDKFFYNMNVYNLNNVSYFPDVEREKSELRGEFFIND